MANEAASCHTSAQLPQTQRLVPGRREGVGAIGGDNAVGNDVAVAVEGALGVAVGGFVASEVPDDERLVARGREKHVRAAASVLVCVFQCF